MPTPNQRPLRASKPSSKQAERLKTVDMPLRQVYELAALGLSTEQIGYFYGLHPWSMELYRRQRPELNETIEQGRAQGVRHAAAALRHQIGLGNTAAIIFYLKARGGWSETNKVELTGKDGGPVRFDHQDANMDLGQLKDSELSAVLALLEKAVRRDDEEQADGG